MTQKRERALAKVLDLESNIHAIQTISQESQHVVKEALMVDFELGDTLYARAHITDPEHPWLWLGAGTMLRMESPEQAIELLTDRLLEARKAANEAEQVLYFLREQVTTVEVCTARFYNLAVSLKKASPSNEAAAQ